jgi:hypothetical protein
MSIVRDNLLNRPGYTPYCGANHCRLGMPRTWFNGEQFQCGCGWKSGFEAAFIEQYKTAGAGASSTSASGKDSK